MSHNLQGFETAISFWIVPFVRLVELPCLFQTLVRRRSNNLFRIAQRSHEEPCRSASSLRRCAVNWEETANSFILHLTMSLREEEGAVRLWRTTVPDSVVCKRTCSSCCIQVSPALTRSVQSKNSEFLPVDFIVPLYFCLCKPPFVELPRYSAHDTMFKICTELQDNTCALGLVHILQDGLNGTHDVRQLSLMNTL